MKNKKRIEELEVQIQKKRDMIAYKFKELENAQRERFLLSIGMTQDIENRMAERKVDVGVILADAEIIRHAKLREDIVRKEWLEQGKELDKLHEEQRILIEEDREPRAKK